MSVLARWMTAAPSPSPSQGPSELEVTPGLAGFLATFAVAVACVLLFLSLTRHLRRATRNAEERGIPVEEPKRIAFGRRPVPQDGAQDSAGADSAGAHPDGDGEGTGDGGAEGDGERGSGG